MSHLTGQIETQTGSKILNDNSAGWPRRLGDVAATLREDPGFDRNLYTAEAIQASIHDIHRNPVERGLCERVIDWKWSSARHDLEVSLRRQFRELPLIHSLPTRALD